MAYIRCIESIRIFLFQGRLLHKYFTSAFETAVLLAVNPRGINIILLLDYPSTENLLQKPKKLSLDLKLLIFPCTRWILCVSLSGK